MEQITIAIKQLFEPDENGRKFSQSDVAKKMDVTRTMVHRWANGKSVPSGENLLKLIKLGYLDISKLK